MKSLYEYKKSLNDWHYDPSVPSIDYQYVGRFVYDFSSCLNDIVWPPEESCVEVYPEDAKKEKNLSWGKEDSRSWGFTDHNSAKQYLSYRNHPERIPSVFQKIAKMSGLENPIIGLTRFRPGQIHPWHFDTYQGVVKSYEEDGRPLSSEDQKRIRRYLIPLQDWHWGHFVQIGNSVLTHWKAGQAFTWDYGMYHLAVNAGIVPRVSAQITGLETEESLHLSHEYEFLVNEYKTVDGD